MCKGQSIKDIYRLAQMTTCNRCCLALCRTGTYSITMISAAVCLEGKMTSEDVHIRTVVFIVIALC